MVFSSSLFVLWFLPLFLVLYYLAANKYKNFVALSASIFFYSWGGPKFIFLILASITIDYYFVEQILKNKSHVNKKKWLLGSLILNLGVLGIFKYFGFFTENLNFLLGILSDKQISWTSIALPIGISFFTFQKITYAIDIYRGKSASTSLGNYALYILLFPQLIAGPIVKFHEIADQIENPDRAEGKIDEKLMGFFRFCLGLAKKVLIADIMAAEVDKIFNLSIHQFSGADAWLGIMAYSFQIYFDFSGYSDMAIGIGKMIGFHFPENFSFPYISSSITEFWRRWHITLGNFMREYLYIPMGGSRVSKKWQLYRNLWVVFLLSGLWHGAAWNFVVWGAFHGTLLALERFFLLKMLNKIPRMISITITYILVLIGWVFFRGENLDFSLHYIDKMFSFAHFEFSSQIFADKEFFAIFIIALFFSFAPYFRAIGNLWNFIFCEKYSAGKAFVFSIFSIVLLIISISYITSSDFHPFIYFRF